MVGRKTTVYRLTVMTLMMAAAYSLLAAAMETPPDENKGGRGRSQSVPHVRVTRPNTEDFLNPSHSASFSPKFNLGDISLPRKDSAASWTRQESSQSRLSRRSSSRRSPTYKEWMRTGRNQRRENIDGASSAISMINALDNESRMVFDVLIRHKDHTVIRAVFELMKEEDLAEAFKQFLRMPPELRKHVVYKPNAKLISHEYRVLSVKGVSGMSLQTGFGESLNELRNNGKLIYLFPMIANGVLYLGNGLIVISSQAYLLNVTLAGALAKAIEDNLMAICAAFERGDDFSLRAMLTGGFFDRLTLTPQGLVIGTLIGVLVALGPLAVKKLIMPMLIWPYKWTLSKGIRYRKEVNRLLRSSESLHRIRYLKSLALSDEEIVDYLGNERINQTLKAVAYDPTRTLKLLEVLARMPEDKRKNLLISLGGLDKYYHAGGNKISKEVCKAAGCCQRFLAIDDSETAAPGFSNSFYYIFCERRNGYSRAVLTSVTTGAILTAIVVGTVYLSPYVFVSGAALASLAKPALNGSCEEWQENGFPNFTVVESELIDVSGSEVGSFGYNTITVAVGIGLPTMTGAVTYAADKIVSGVFFVCSAFGRCLCGRRSSDSDNEMEEMETSEQPAIFSFPSSPAATPKVLEETITEVTIEMGKLTLNTLSHPERPDLLEESKLTLDEKDK
ncbi:hypothetical protein M3P05_16745 [Sansalvadorimonas sp. 2012CJ34-2]|uniref:Uncharacterized protein n=1 Tax=Parendozoicomonas callyspongiae TaxID=2942213 RepID=A0ABT0PJW7_9GAMM|nr:hypothetical protein [Sansalvadorimonas sp. 2012CJ34-2]MCL6271566.1 hypothetical protein [Sansalvadorimonas sp. 2012CJ34-2]